MLKYINFMETADDVSRTTISNWIFHHNESLARFQFAHISSFSIAICDEYGAL